MSVSNRDISDPPTNPTRRVDYETDNLDRNNYIAAIIHLYRGEVSRANAWRMRLDQTTNWAVLTTASALGFAFGRVDASHFSLQFANLLLLVLLTLEARRFRFFDVWRSRIRMIETNFFGPILLRHLHSPESDWGALVAADLNEPHFHVTKLQALRLRLVRNYLPIFGVILLGWVIKLVIHPWATSDILELYQRCALGPVGPAASLGVIAAFYVMLAVILVVGHTERQGRDNWGIGELVQEEMQ